MIDPDEIAARHALNKFRAKWGREYRETIITDDDYLQVGRLAASQVAQPNKYIAAYREMGDLAGATFRYVRNSRQSPHLRYYMPERSCDVSELYEELQPSYYPYRELEEQEARCTLIRRLMRTLDDRERMVIEVCELSGVRRKRNGDNPGKHLSAYLGITQSRVSQIRKEAIRKMREAA